MGENVKAFVRLRLKLYDHVSAAAAAAVMQPFIVFGKIPPSLLWMWNKANRDLHWQVYHAEKETGSEERHNNAAISDQIIIYRGFFLMRM